MKSLSSKLKQVDPSGCSSLAGSSWESLKGARFTAKRKWLFLSFIVILKINKNGVINAMINEFGYFSKEVATELDITTSTLRRWSIELEKTGYYFERNDNNQRIYYERDFRAFRELKNLLSNNVPFVDAIKAVSAMNFDNKINTKTPSVSYDIVRLSRRDLEDIVTKVIEKERSYMLEVFEEKLKNEIEIRDRLLLKRLNQSLTDNKKHVNKRLSLWERIFKRWNSKK